MQTKHFIVGKLHFEVHPTSEAAGIAAARAAAEILFHLKLDHRRNCFGVVFATGASQLTLLTTLTSMPGLPWESISGFHLDEYVDISPSHPGSFRRYLREHLTQRVPIKKFHEIDGNTLDPVRMCEDYVAKLRSCDPQLCLLGIGENGHLAFNDPEEADFEDPKGMKMVQLDAICRRQQLAEGWFKRLEEVPERAFTLTIPTVLQVPKLIVSVPGPRKAGIVRQLVEGPISTACPATILRTHPGATVYLDSESAAELDSALVSQACDR